MKVALGLVGLVVVAIVASGLASLPYADANGVCGPYFSETSDVVIEQRWFPYGTDCVGFRFFGPGALGLTAAFSVTTIIVGLTVWLRRKAWVRGAALAIAVVAIFGLLANPQGFGFGAFVTLIVSVPLIVAADFRFREHFLASPMLSVVLPLGAMFAWGFVYLAGMPIAGVACAALVGALASVAVGPVAAWLHRSPLLPVPFE